MSKTDKAWKYFGQDDPYHGVLTKEGFRKEEFDDAARRAFFESGEGYVDHVLSVIRNRLDPSYAPNRALDFGCGVGRLTLPLARRVGAVVGVDVSEGMLAEAASNAVEQGLANVEFVMSDDQLSRARGRFDLVHSFIVFQHIPPPRGEAIIGQLLDRLDDGGVAVLHLTYADSSRTPLRRRLLTTAYERVPYATHLRNALKREPLGKPIMQMNRYDLSRVFRILQEAGFHDVHVRFSEASHLGYPVLGALIFARKTTLDTTTHS